MDSLSQKELISPFSLSQLQRSSQDSLFLHDILSTFSQHPLAQQSSIPFGFGKNQSQSSCSLGAWIPHESSQLTPLMWNPSLLVMSVVCECVAMPAVSTCLSAVMRVRSCCLSAVVKV